MSAINGFFLSSHYIKSIENYLKDEIIPFEKIDLILNKIIEDRSNINIIGTSKFFNKTRKSIRILLETKPGVELFEELFKHRQTLTIVSGEEKKESYYDGNTKKLYLDTASSFFSITRNSEDEKEFDEVPRKLNVAIGLAHELIHFLHDLKDPDGRNLTTDEQLEDPDFDDIEERNTIIALFLCENVFRRALNCPLRVNHRGIILKKGSVPTVCDMVYLDVLGSLKKTLQQDLSLLNSPQDIKWRKPDKEKYKKEGFLLPEKALPLSVAAFKGKTEIVNLLIHKGADINLCDDFGGPLHAAYLENHYELFSHLLDKKINCNLKNTSGLTPIMVVIRDFPLQSFREGITKVQIFEELIEKLAPLSNLTETNPADMPIWMQALKCPSKKAFLSVLQKMPDINYRNEQGDTPLISAIKADCDWLSNFEILLNIKGLDFEAKNNRGESALSLAIQMNNKNLINALVSNGAKMPDDQIPKTKKPIKKTQIPRRNNSWF